jgi:hypothetical protein
MKNHWMLVSLALLGIFGSGRLGDSQESDPARPADTSTQKGLPAIDTAVPVKTATATFALG